MKAPTDASAYRLLFRGKKWEKSLSPEQLNQFVTDWYAWFQQLDAGDKCSGVIPLLNTGKLVSGKKRRVVADGPFAESKERVGRFFHPRVANEAEAVQIAQLCLGLKYDCWTIQARPVGEQDAERLRKIRHMEDIATSITTRP